MDKTPPKILLVEGMTCTNCALGVKKIIEKNGGENVYVNFSTGEAKYNATGKSSEANVHDQIAQGINKGGYKVIHSASNEKYSTVEKLFVFCLIFTLPLFMHMFVSHDSILNDPIFQICLTIPVLLSGGVFFIKSAIGSLRVGVPNMDVLVSVGVLSSFFYSAYGVYIYWGAPNLHDYLFFETTATVTTLVLLGNVIEHRAVRKTTSAISDLSALQIDTANKVVDGKVVVVNIEEINIGDTLQINDGDIFPLDGVVTQGEFEVDESMISGESEPVYKAKGASVIGSSLVISGTGQMIASTINGRSTLDRIISLVKDAQESKPEIQKLGDRISAVFVPIVIGIALLTFLVSYFGFDSGLQKSLMQSIAVLVISCPCAMGLAAPTAIIVGIGKAAKKGILIKGGQTLEKIAKSKTIVFDKTGTLTTGNFTIDKMKINGITEDVASAIIVSLCSKSSHPISKSLHTQLKEMNIPTALTNVREEKGKGLSGIDDSNGAWGLYSTKSQNAKNSTELASDLCLVYNDEIVGELSISDEVKPGVKESIAWLKSHGVIPIMLSGDKKSKCETVSKNIGITEFYFEKSPEDKLNIITKLNQTNPTIMVGDGINDAPALAQAHVGISFGAATNSAINSADVVLMNKNFLSITNTISLSRQTYKTIKQNFFWAFAYNALAIPIAAFGFLKPMVAALSMAFSDVVVIGNSILLKFKKEK
ncbi:MAG: Cu+-exporting ATPase [Saprospiraceae bacterium]|jgi:Cu+-exporting ATPase